MVVATAIKTPHTQGRNLESNIFLPNSSSDISVLSRFETDLGVKFNSCKWYEDWSDPFYVDIAKRFSDHGCIPELTWQPQIGGNGVSYDNVTAGQYDAYLDQFSASVKSFGSPVRISLAPEMNSEWAPWGVTNNGNTTESHKTFWRYVINRFRNNGVTNVSWIWSPNVRFYGDPCSYGQIYPGDEYVDFVGLDGYNWGTTQSWSVWQSFSEVFGQSYNEITSISSKNVLIMEVASAESGGDKAAWITAMFSDLRNKFTRIQGFTWFSINKETDWRINSSEKSRIAFSNGVNGTSTPSSTTTNTPSTGSSKSSESINKKGSKSFQLVVENVDDQVLNEQKESSVENTTVPKQTNASFDQSLKSTGFIFSKKKFESLINSIMGTNLLSKLYMTSNFLFLILVLLVNRRLHRTHLRSQYNY